MYQSAAERQKAYRDAHKEQKKAYDKAYNETRRVKRSLHRLAGIHGTPQEHYDKMLSDQGGACAICGRGPTPGRWLCVDHDHETGIVRGLLCVNCNTMLGQAHDDTLLLDRAIGYLAEFGGGLLV